VAHEMLGRISYLTQDSNACYIGLKKLASIALLTYDLQVALTHSLFHRSMVRIALSTPSSPGCSCGP
jgi:hypothetical protein